MSYTEGPWGVTQMDDASMVIAPPKEPGKIVQGRTQVRIAVCEYSHYTPKEEADANAKLIAAAPLAVELAQQIMFSKDYSLIRKMAAEFLEKAGEK